MRRVLMAAIASLALSSQASAQDWTGFYVGVHGGYGWGSSSTSSDDSVWSFGSGRVSADTDGAFAGATFGYNARIDRMLVGVELDYSWAGIDGRGVDGSNIATADINRFGSLTGRLGYAFGPTLLYVKGGLGFANVRNYAIDLADTLDETSVKDTQWGFTIGGGMEYKFAKQWSLKAEYQFFDFDDQRSVNVPDGDVYKHANDLHVVKIGINYSFGN